MERQLEICIDRTVESMKKSNTIITRSWEKRVPNTNY